MSADQYDAEQAGPSALAQPAVDILPMAGAKKGRTAPDAAPDSPPVDAYPAPLPAPAPGWQPPAVNPWTGAPESSAPVDAVPVAPVEAVPAAAVAPVAAVETLVPADEQNPQSAKKFLGMQLRRGRKEEATEAAQAPSPAQPVGNGVGPVAAWPTDVSVSVVAGAEPAAGAWGPPLQGPPADAVPVSYAYGDSAAVEPADAVPVEADDPPVTVAVGPPPFPLAAGVPAPAPVVDDEVRVVRAQLEASESARAAAELRADQAVAYAQQVQAELGAAREEAAAKLAAVETKARTAANDAQDWQIRHREAEAQISDLVTSVGGAEQRLAELRTERDELLAALEEATSPVTAAESADVSPA